MSGQTLQQPTENGWMIDETVNDGFPFACDFVPDAFDSQNVKSIWDFSADGFPSCSSVFSPDFSKVKSVWKIHVSVNDGFPHIQGVFEITPTPSIFPRFTGFFPSPESVQISRQFLKVQLFRSQKKCISGFRTLILSTSSFRKIRR